MTSTKKGSSNFSSFLKSSRMLHIQMAVAPLILGAVILYINNETIDFSFTQEPLEFIVPVVLVGVLFLSNFLFQKSLGQIKSTFDLKKKLGAYLGAHIIRIALIEGITILGLVLCMNFSNLYFLIFAVLGIGILVSLFPTKSGIEKSLNLSMEEQVYLNNPDKPFSDQED